MKKKVILINTSRGAVIDTKALIKNIEKFKYVGLDVLEDEQEFSKNHPLLNFKNVVITPHCAFFTDKSSKNIAQKAKEIAQSFKYE
jgi:D-lactate dehydrogenase